MRNDISYVLVDTQNYELSRYALDVSQARFPLRHSIIFSDREDCWNDRLVCRIPKMQSLRDYNHCILYELPKHLKTPYALIIQYDGFVLDGELFSDSFLQWDYIGAILPHFPSHSVGNGGFSLRSKRLINSVQRYLLPSDLHVNEDEVICRHLRATLEDAEGIKFAPESTAERFSFELCAPKSATFGFHGVFHLPKIVQQDLLYSHLNPRSVAKHFELFAEGMSAASLDQRSAFTNYCISHKSEILAYKDKYMPS